MKAQEQREKKRRQGQIFPKTRVNKNKEGGEYEKQEERNAVRLKKEKEAKTSDGIIWTKMQ